MMTNKEMKALCKELGIKLPTSAVVRERAADEKCVFCGDSYEHGGHNPWPACKVEDARCCTYCNFTVVLPARLPAGIDKKALDDVIVACLKAYDVSGRSAAAVLSGVTPQGEKPVMKTVPEIREYFKMLEDRGLIFAGTVDGDCVMCWEDIDAKMVYVWNCSNASTDRLVDDYPSAGMTDEQLLKLFESGEPKNAYSEAEGYLPHNSDFDAFGAVDALGDVNNS